MIRRDDIQGLRGVAVALVVAYHTGASVEGGFTGVDVFFVISGFVITAMLMREHDERGGIELRRFYVRRARRLLPALGLVMALTVVGSAIQGVWETLRTGLAAAVFNANHALIWLGDGGALSHTWSLSVEEQFYFVHPLLLVAVWKRGGRLVPVLACVVAVSFVLAVAVGGSFAFHSMLTRAWQLCAGGLLAATGYQLATRWAGAVGLLAICACGLLFELGGYTPVVAALPALATLLVLAAPFGPASGLLSWRPVTWFGDLSYSWYLWHWPLMVFAADL